jgi:hypothetical protein
MKQAGLVVGQIVDHDDQLMVVVWIDYEKGEAGLVPIEWTTYAMEGI